MSTIASATGQRLARDDRLWGVPRFELTGGPSPVHRVRRLEEAVGGPALWFKRDDLLDFGMGGNKVRGLEYLLADARSRGADTIVTGAGPRSNHVRASAAAAAVAGLRMVAVYWGHEPAVADGNLLLTRLFGGETRFTGSDDRASVDDEIGAVRDEMVAAGRRPYAIPRGGASSLGSIGHIRAVAELADQVDAAGVEPDRIVLAVGSGGTLAGWLLGTALLGRTWRITGYPVSRPAGELRARIVSLAAEAAERLGVPLPEGLEAAIDLRDGVIGDGYAVPTAEGTQALQLVARSEGIVLDATYTAKAFAGYRADVAAGRFDDALAAVFLHTGGEPPRTPTRG